MKEENTLKVFACDYVQVKDEVFYVSFSCSHTEKDSYYCIEAPEFYTPVSIYWTPVMARGPSIGGFGPLINSEKQFA